MGEDANKGTTNGNWITLLAFYLGRLSARDETKAWNKIALGRVAELQERALDRALLKSCIDFYLLEDAVRRHSPRGCWPRLAPGSSLGQNFTGSARPDAPDICDTGPWSRCTPSRRDLLLARYVRGPRSKSGSLAILAAIRRASSQVSKLAALERRNCLFELPKDSVTVRHRIPPIYPCR